MTRFMLSAVAASALLTACATAQENPNYQYSTKYKAATPTNYASSTHTGQVQAAPVSYHAPASYQTASSQSATSYNSVDQACLRKEQNRELIGGALGGAVGAIAGKKLIGGTAGTVVGAGLGGTLGYGLGDKSVNCDPVAVSAVQPAAVYQAPASQSYGVTNTAYSNVHSQNVSLATYPGSYTCPVGTTVQANGTCLQGEASSQVASVQSASVQTSYIASTSAVSAPTDSHYQQAEIVGTPGYQALQAQTYESSIASAPVAQPVHVAQSSMSSPSQSVAYDYSENLVQASAATAPIASQTYTLGGSSAVHAVTQGDTVYSLSRKLCVGVSDIQSLNGLDHNYGIKIGDSLNLPASRC